MASDVSHCQSLEPHEEQVESPIEKGEAKRSKAGRKQPLNYSSAELEDFLGDDACVTIFEDAEDEVHHLRRRGDVLAQELLKARREMKRLHEAGARLQDAYESLQKEYREVAGDAVYWQALAEAREEEIEKASQVPKKELAEGTKVAELSETASEEKASEVKEHEKIDPREALRRAAADAAQAEAARRRKLAQQRAEEAAVQLLHNSTAAGQEQDNGKRQSPNEVGQASVGSQEVGQTSVGSCLSESMASTPRRPRGAWGEARGCSAPDLNRTPPRSRSGSGCSSPCSSRSFNASISSSSSRLASSRATASPAPGNALKWGIGSSPKRCPGMGTPTRRQAQGAHGGYTSQGASPMRASEPVPAAAKPGQGKIASLVSLWERKKPSSSESSVRSSQGTMLSVASPARPAARPPMPSRPGDAANEDKRRAELARLIGLSPSP
mmetsp:Transcript_44239/g.79581  ORF Transcript_44239/g.79581 Transcript_44239/m.79581 type:complete len:440 (+) Transcript_44239:48-1367(+)|eukprot:CAMPEP_0197626054 /NCGR_PEP_ID=MMETSP1338-20131121/5205_1 /TAXON_ID=43686 ORGANISM="Pelagodinium beii, Strain RCC1491" /NCGR_SAMPLE_ID=MMETSP1338 /ASSEMBLY_ACC=CAM_ASM_000754 /LENGTH=439 /DNA_ID=CAMNT_0043196571 /DNA_START=45 /DNA_END=1364 /DNA_ORIENTATION=-